MAILQEALDLSRSPACSVPARQPQRRLLVLQPLRPYRHRSLWCVSPPGLPFLCLRPLSRRPPFCLFSMAFSSDEISPVLRCGVRGKNVFLLSLPSPRALRVSVGGCCLLALRKHPSIVFWVSLLLCRNQASLSPLSGGVFLPISDFPWSFIFQWFDYSVLRS